MKTEIDLSLLNVTGKWFCIGELKEGTNRCFKYYKSFSRGCSTRKERVLFVYLHNGEIVRNATDLREVYCLSKFEKIKNLKGDSSTIPFECNYPLEILN